MDGKNTRPYDLFTRPGIWVKLLPFVDSLHHYVNVSYLFIKLEPIKQIKRFESCLFYLHSNTNTSSIKTKGFKQLKTNTLLLRHHYLQRSNQVIEKYYQTDIESNQLYCLPSTDRLCKI